VIDPNRALFESVVRLLGPLLDDLVFVGGCTTGLLLTDPAGSVIRPTRDVDAIVDVASYAKYSSIAERLRAVGLAEDTTPGAPLCRWRRDHLVIDVMPIDASVLGFTNRWYRAAIETADIWVIAGHEVRVITPVLFLATKLVAFRGRGGGDVLASHDLEDIVTVVDGRAEIVDELPTGPAEVRAYIAAEIRSLLDDRDFLEALPGFLLPDPASQARRGMLEQILRRGVWEFSHAEVIESVTTEMREALLEGAQSLERMSAAEIARTIADVRRRRRKVEPIVVAEAVEATARGVVDTSVLVAGVAGPGRHSRNAHVSLDRDGLPQDDRNSTTRSATSCGRPVKGSLISVSQDPVASCGVDHVSAGWMFWFPRKKFVGSYFCLSAASRW